MRIFLVATTIAVLALSTHANAMGGGKGKHHADAQQTDDPAKKKASEQAYSDALKRIPVSDEKTDPWKSVR